MFRMKSEAQIDGDGNIVVQNVSGSTIIINPDNSEEVRDFLVDFNQKLNELPLEIVALLEEKSKQMDKEMEKVANVYLTVLIITEGVKANIVALGITITNLKREIRYFNQPYFMVYPKIQLKEGIKHDAFSMIQGQTPNFNVKYPKRLEFGETVDSNYPVNANLFQKFKEINQEDAYIQAFVTTTIGEICSSRKYPISTFVQDYQSTLKTL